MFHFLDKKKNWTEKSMYVQNPYAMNNTLNVCSGHAKISIVFIRSRPLIATRWDIWHVVYLITFKNYFPMTREIRLSSDLCTCDDIHDPIVILYKSDIVETRGGCRIEEIKHAWSRSSLGFPSIKLTDIKCYSGSFHTSFTMDRCI
jgi:hypothetical protein